MDSQSAETGERCVQVEQIRGDLSITEPIQLSDKLGEGAALPSWREFNLL